MSQLPPLSPLEETQLSSFREFYERLPEKDGIFYMFFTSGLLHWAVRTSRLASRAARVVLIGSGLDPEEVSWLESHSDLPFHHIPTPADDKTVWEILFRTNRHNFGWIDVDCFVLNPDLLVEMRRIDRDVLANCVWSIPQDGHHLLNTYFLFLNAEAIRDVTAQVPVAPSTYSYVRSRDSRSVPDGFCRLLTPALIERLARILPCDGAGMPRYLPAANAFFDTLLVYQFVAQTLGYRLGRVRPLRFENTDEIVHIGRVSYYDHAWREGHLPENQKIMSLLYLTELLMLDGLHESLPPRYGQRWERIKGQLMRRGLPTEAKAVEQILRRLMAGSGLSEQTLGRMMGADRAGAQSPLPKLCTQMTR